MTRRLTKDTRRFTKPLPTQAGHQARAVNTDIGADRRNLYEQTMNKPPAEPMPPTQPRHAPAPQTAGTSNQPTAPDPPNQNPMRPGNQASPATHRRIPMHPCSSAFIGGKSPQPPQPRTPPASPSATTRRTPNQNPMHPEPTRPPTRQDPVRPDTHAKGRTQEPHAPREPRPVNSPDVHPGPIAPTHRTKTPCTQSQPARRRGKTPCTRTPSPNDAHKNPMRPGNHTSPTAPALTPDQSPQHAEPKPHAPRANPNPFPSAPRRARIPPCQSSSPNRSITSPT